MHFNFVCNTMYKTNAEKQIPLLQLVPVMPAGQVQVKVVGLFFVQVPPFQHG